MSRFISSLVLIAFLFASVTDAFAITRKIKFVYDPRRSFHYEEFRDFCYAPEWSTSKFASAPNSTYMNVEFQTILGESRTVFADPEFLGGPTLDRGSVIAMRTQYQDMLQGNESAVAYDQANDSAAQRGYFQKLKDFSKFVVRSVLSFQIKEGFKRAEKKNDAIRTFSRVQKSIRQMAYQSLDVTVVPSFKFGTKTDIPQQKGLVWLNSPLFNGQFEVNFGESWKPKTTAEEALKNGTGKELFSASISRPLPLWSVSSGLSYGGTSSNLTATLSSPLPYNVRGVLSYAYGLDRNRTTIPGGREQTVTFLYDLTF